MVPPGREGSDSDSSSSNLSVEQRTTIRTRILAFFIKWIPSRIRGSLWNCAVLICLTSALFGIGSGMYYTGYNKQCLVCWTIGVLGAAASICLFGITYESPWDKILGLTIFLGAILALVGISEGIYYGTSQQNCLDCWLMGGIPLTIVIALCLIFRKKVLEALRGNIQVHPQPPPGGGIIPGPGQNGVPGQIFPPVPQPPLGGGVIPGPGQNGVPGQIFPPVPQPPPGGRIIPGPGQNGVPGQIVPPVPLPNGVAIHMVPPPPPGQLDLEQQEGDDDPPPPNGNAVILEPLQPEVPEPLQEENVII